MLLAVEVIDRYEIIEKLGQGGMAEVFLARQRGPRGFVRQAVLKRIHTHLADDPVMIQRFHDEARLAGLFNHPNIVRLEDFGEAEGRPYLVLEHIDGDDIQGICRRALAAGVGLPLRLTFQIVADIARALEYAHQLKDDEGRHLQVIHRDVSPDNIVLTQQGQAKLLDFGIARASTNQHKTVAGAMKGKVSYFSPEQMRGVDVSPRSDQFSLGVVLWETLTRVRLFERHDDLETLKAVRRCWVPAVTRLNRGVPTGVANALARCVAKDPRYRFEHCGELAEILERSISEAGGRLEGEDLKRWLSTLPEKGRALPVLSEELLEERSKVSEQASSTNPNTPNLAATDVVQAQTRLVTSEMKELSRLRSRSLPQLERQSRAMIIGIAMGLTAVFMGWLIFFSGGGAPKTPSAQTLPAKVRIQADDPKTKIIAPDAPEKGKKPARRGRRGRQP